MRGEWRATGVRPSRPPGRAPRKTDVTSRVEEFFRKVVERRGLVIELVTVPGARRRRVVVRSWPGRPRLTLLGPPADTDLSADDIKELVVEGFETDYHGLGEFVEELIAGLLLISLIVILSSLLSMPGKLTYALFLALGAGSLLVLTKVSIKLKKGVEAGTAGRLGPPQEVLIHGVSRVIESLLRCADEVCAKRDSGLHVAFPGLGDLCTVTCRSVRRGEVEVRRFVIKLRAPRVLVAEGALRRQA